MIDTPEAAERFAAVLEANKPIDTGDFKFEEADDEFIREVLEKYSHKQV